MYKQTFLALLYLHADKAKDLQINLSEALQGNIQFLFVVSFALTRCFLLLI